MGLLHESENLKTPFLYVDAVVARNRCQQLEALYAKLTSLFCGRGGEFTDSVERFQVSCRFACVHVFCVFKRLYVPGDCAAHNQSPAHCPTETTRFSVWQSQRKFSNAIRRPVTLLIGCISTGQPRLQIRATGSCTHRSTAVTPLHSSRFFPITLILAGPVFTCKYLISDDIQPIVHLHSEIIRRYVRRLDGVNIYVLIHSTEQRFLQPISQISGSSCGAETARCCGTRDFKFVCKQVTEHGTQARILAVAFRSQTTEGTLFSKYSLGSF